jgi:hypothetical protein
MSVNMLLPATSLVKKHIVSAKKSTDSTISAKKSIFAGRVREGRSAEARKHSMTPSWDEKQPKCIDE